MQWRIQDFPERTLQNEYSKWKLAWKQNRQRCTYVHLKNFILVAFHVDCKASQVEVIRRRIYQYIYTLMNRRNNSQNFLKIIHESSVNCTSTAIGSQEINLCEKLEELSQRLNTIDKSMRNFIDTNCSQLLIDRGMSLSHLWISRCANQVDIATNLLFGQILLCR